MLWVHDFGRASGIAVAALIFSGCAFSYATDIGPRTGSASDASAGRAIALDGDEQFLYAVSLNAGLFRTGTGTPGGLGPWVQLAASPRLASTIAVPFGQSQHVAVGERNGDAIGFGRHRGGVWESTDAGITWALAWNPASEPDCVAAQSGAVPALLFSPTGTLLAGSSCGLFRRQGTTFARVSPDTIDLVGALAAGDSRLNPTHLFALGRTKANPSQWNVLESLDDGQHWTVNAIPDTVGNQTLAFKRWQPPWVWNNKPPFEQFSLAGVGDSAAISFHSDSPNPNHLFVLYYRSRHGSAVFTVQDSGVGDGTGLNGRHRVRTVDLSATNHQLGFGSQIFLVGGQSVHRGEGVDENGQVAGWRAIGWTPEAGNNILGLHADIWDAFVTTAPNDPQGTVWLATDGGVFRAPLQEQGLLAWSLFDDGLRTHSISSVVALPSPDGTALAYATADNSEWYRPAAPFVEPMAGWTSTGALGDGHFALSDPLNPSLAVVARSPTMVVIHFNGTASPTPQVITGWNGGLDWNDLAGSPWTFQILPTPIGVAPLHTELVALASAPPSQLAGGPSSGPVLLRNGQWEVAPDINLNPFKTDWSYLTGDRNPLPAGTKAVYPATGASGTIFYLLVEEQQQGALYLLTRPVARTKLGWGVRRIDTGSPLLLPDAQILQSAPNYGPVYVNPYDSAHLFVLTTTGVRVTVDGGATFSDDKVLTALVTGSGKYPLVAANPSLNRVDMPLIPCSGSIATVAQIAFRSDGGHAAVVASPFAGVFFAPDDRRQWLDLGATLPAPRAPVASVALDADAAYVATVGRGLFRVNAPSLARFATYFQPGVRATVTLMRSDGTPVGNVPVEAFSVLLGARAAELHDNLQTDPFGQLTMPHAAPGTVVHLRFAGTTTAAPSEAPISF